MTHIQSGGTPLDCLTLRSVHSSFGGADINGPSYCLSTNTTVLRAITNHGATLQTLLNNISLFQGHYVARELVNIWKQKKRFSIQVTALEALADSDVVAQTPPADAVLASNTTVEITAVDNELLSIKKVPPIYPMQAKSRSVEGMIVIKAQINEHGRPMNLRVLSGPIALQDAALEAVRQWWYKPYSIYGETSSVDTTINVVFIMGGELHMSGASR